VVWVVFWGEQESRRKVRIVIVKSWYNLNVLDYVLWGCMAVAVPVVITIILAIVGWFFVRPVYRLRSHIGEIDAALAFYANVYCNNKVVSDDKKDEAERVLRAKATELDGRAYEVIWYRLWARVKIVPRKKEIEEASAVLMALANSVHDGDVRENSNMRKRVEKLLGIARR